MAEKVGAEKNLTISWSGDRSKAVASALHKWIPQFIQSVNPWMSPDIEKGVRWALDLAEEFEKTSVGIICLTPENLTAPWILFEAGAISKAMKDSRACTYLFDLEHTDVKNPLAQLNHTQAEKEDTKKMLHTINKALGTPERPLIKGNQLDTAFEKFWPDLENDLTSIPLPPKLKTSKRTQEDKTDEILELVRRLHKEGASQKFGVTAGDFYIQGAIPSNVYASGLAYDTQGRIVPGRNPVTGETQGGLTVIGSLLSEGDDKEKEEDKDK